MVQHPHAELSAYIDAALDPAAKAALDGHLVACALCRAHLAQLRATAAFVHALPDPVPSRRLVPRVAAAPAWLAPLRTLMTLASGAAIFLFIASALVTNITFLAGSGAATSAQESSRDAAARGRVPAAAQPAASGTTAPVPQASPNAAFAVAPTASPQGRGTVDAATPNAKRLDDSSARPSVAPGDLAFNPQDAARTVSSAPQRSPLLNPWLWLALAIVSGAIAIALHRRLHASI